MPKYREIEGALRSRIETGAWPPGASIPTEAALAQEFACTRPTVARAMGALVRDGLVERRRRAGSNVVHLRAREVLLRIPRIRAEIEGSGRAYGYRRLLRRVAPPPRGIAALFGPDSALHLTCLHSADGRPHQIEDRWINLAAVPHAADQSFRTDGPNDWLVATVPFTRAEHRLSAAAATPTEARLLEIAPGAPVFVIARTTWKGAAAVTRVNLTHPGAAFRLTARDAG